jgi:hypothetical protein
VQNMADLALISRVSFLNNTGSISTPFI